jgi:hypothetical protein
LSQQGFWRPLPGDLSRLFLYNANRARGTEGAVKILAFSTAVSNQNDVSINAIVGEVENWW